MAAYGVDGCPAGWFYVCLSDDQYSFGTVPTLSTLITKATDDSQVFIDIPIGLWDAEIGPRGCDTMARRLLGPARRSSVFPAALRSILDAEEFESALQRSRAMTGKGLSKQSFALFPKIREVDNLLNTSVRARKMVREIHPELCFWAFGGGKAMKYRKKKREGFDERMDVLASVFPEARDLADEALAIYKRKDVARDDIADALVAAATASSEPEALLSIPANAIVDSRGLRMEMVINCKLVETVF